MNDTSGDDTATASERAMRLEGRSVRVAGLGVSGPPAWRVPAQPATDASTPARASRRGCQGRVAVPASGPGAAIAAAVRRRRQEVSAGITGLVTQARPARHEMPVQERQPIASACDWLITTGAPRQDEHAAAPADDPL